MITKEKLDAVNWRHIRTDSPDMVHMKGLLLKTYSGAASVNYNGERTNEISGTCRVYRGGANQWAAWRNELIWSENPKDKIGEKYDDAHCGAITVYWAFENEIK